MRLTKEFDTRVYVDGSYDHTSGTGGVGIIIQKNFKYCSCSNIQELEMQAIKEAINLLQPFDGQPCCIYSDNTAAVDAFNPAPSENLAVRYIAKDAGYILHVCADNLAKKSREALNTKLDYDLKIDSVFSDQQKDQLEKEITVVVANFEKPGSQEYVGNIFGQIMFLINIINELTSKSDIKDMVMDDLIRDSLRMKFVKINILLNLIKKDDPFGIGRFLPRIRNFQMETDSVFFEQEKNINNFIDAINIDIPTIEKGIVQIANQYARVATAMNCSIEIQKYTRSLK